MKTTALELEFPKDPIQPSTIQHGLDEARHPSNGSGEPGTLEFCYNYLDYQFQTPSGAIHARSYLDNIKRVTIHPRPEQMAEPLLEDIKAYLARRYRVVRVE